MARVSKGETPVETQKIMDLAHRTALLVSAVLIACMALLASGALQAREAQAANVKKPAAAAVKAAGTTSGTAKARLKKAANYAVKKFSYQRNSNIIAQEQNARANASGWWKACARTMFKTKKGSCYNDAAAFAAMAKVATGCPVRVASGKAKTWHWKRTGSKTATQYHSWAEVKLGGTWYVYDTTLGRYSVSKAST